MLGSALAQLRATGNRDMHLRHDGPAAASALRALRAREARMHRTGRSLTAFSCCPDSTPPVFQGGFLQTTRPSPLRVLPPSWPDPGNTSRRASEATARITAHAHQYGVQWLRPCSRCLPTPPGHRSQDTWRRTDRNASFGSCWGIGRPSRREDAYVIGTGSRHHARVAGPPPRTAP
jgi:hypothetical protein